MGAKAHYHIQIHTPVHQMYGRGRGRPGIRYRVVLGGFYMRSEWKRATGMV